MKKKLRLKRWLPIFLMGLPGLAYFFINSYMPLYGLLIAFEKYNFQKGVFGSEWVGFKNFQYLFATKDAFVITRNTILYNLLFIALDVILGITVAIFMNEIRSKLGKKVFQTLVLLPYLMSFVVISYLAYAFFGDTTGLINGLFKRLGLPRIAFYTKKQYWPWILTFVHCWKNVGYQSVIYLSSIVGIDGSLYEAAEMDGAGKWQQIKSITLPLLKPTVIMMVTLAMGMIFRSDFGLFYQVPRNQGLLYPVTDTIDTYVFRALINDGNISMSSAAAFYQSIVCFVTMMVFNTIMNKRSKEDALF